MAKSPGDSSGLTPVRRPLCSKPRQKFVQTS